MDTDDVVACLQRRFPGRRPVIVSGPGGVTEKYLLPRGMTIRMFVAILRRRVGDGTTEWVGLRHDACRVKQHVTVNDMFTRVAVDGVLHLRKVRKMVW